MTPERPAPPYAIMKPAEIRPRGWILEQLRLDLRKGIAGHYDKISGNVAQNLFAGQNRVAGTRLPGNRGLEEKDWWAGEHEGYWMDGLLRMAILTDDPVFLDRCRLWVENILAAFKNSGYIGIYDGKSRFPSKGFDGEFWTQSRAFQALLCWHEYSGDLRVLNAVTATVRRTIDHYRATTYFGRQQVDGGGLHGIGYADTLEWLHHLTGDPYFSEAIVWLYEDYSRSDCSLNDLKVKNMVDRTLLWQDHTPHVAEGLHLPYLAWFFSGRPEYLKAAGKIPVNLARHTSPGGGFVAGNLEAIAGAYGSGDTGNEYCSQTEAIQTLNRLLAYSGDLFYGDWIEKCALNAAQGARMHPENSGVIYLSRDNRLRADNPDILHGREIFSPSHQAAACCALNSVRLLPYYVEGMWYRSGRDDEILACHYGPCELSTTLKGAELRIEETTSFPFSDKVRFHVHLKAPLFFTLSLRIPINCGKPCVSKKIPASIDIAKRTIRISREWHDGDVLEADFDFQVKRMTQHDGKEAYYQWGPLVFSLPIREKKTVIQEVSNTEGRRSGFFDYALSPESETGWDYTIDPGAEFSLVRLDGGDSAYPWVNPGIALEGTFLTLNGEKVTARLVPLGTTLLRRTTFPIEPVSDIRQAKPKINENPEDDPMRGF